MKYKFFLDVVRKVREYDLFDEIGNLEQWCDDLNKRQIRNFLSLNLKGIDNIDSIKSTMVDKTFLNSKYFASDLKLITDSKDEDIRKALIEAAKNPNSINSEHHNNDMDFISYAKNKVILGNLLTASTSITSLNNVIHNNIMSMLANTNEEISSLITHVLCNCSYSNYFSNDVHLVFSSKTLEIARCLSIMAVNYGMYKSPYHAYEMNIVYNAKNNLIAQYLCDVITNCRNYNDVNYIKDITMLSNAKDDATAAVLYSMLMEKDLLESEYHEQEMKYIINARSRTILTCLCILIFDPESKNNPLYIQNLEIISKANDDVAQRLLRNMITENKIFKEEQSLDFDEHASSLIKKVK